MSLAPASGIGQLAGSGAKAIRFVRHGCTNREFFHIVIADVRISQNILFFCIVPERSCTILLIVIYLQRKKEQFQPVVEQVGTFDPMPNTNDEKLLSLNFERIRYWLGRGAEPSKPVAELLGNLET